MDGIALGIAQGLVNAAFTESNNKRQQRQNEYLMDKQNLYNEKMAAQQNAWNRENARWAYDYEAQKNLEFWNKQNQYNDPSDQVQRLRKAGLNPYMLNASSDAGNASAVTPPDMKTPDAVGYPSAGVTTNFQAPQIQLDNVIDKIYNQQLREKQLQQIDANIAKTEAETQNFAYTGDLLVLKKFYETIHNRYADELFSSDISRRNVAISKLMQDIALSKYKLENYMPLEVKKVEWQNKQLAQRYGFDESANPLRLAQLRYDNAYRILRNTAQRTENKYLGNYLQLRNRIMDGQDTAIWYQNQLTGWQNSLMNNMKNGNLKQAVKDATNYYYFNSLMRGMTPTDTFLNNFRAPLKALGLDPMTNTQSALGIFGSILSKGLLPPNLQTWHEREMIDPTTGEVFNYQRWR